MTTLKLIKGYSWGNGRVYASKDDPFLDVDDDKAALYIATGYFAAAERPPDVEPEPDPGKLIKNMNMGELEACARWYKISGKGLRTKADYIKALTEQLGDGPITYGDSNARALTEGM